MFKKFRNALTEVTEEVKSSPRFQNLNQFAAQTYSSMNSDSPDPSQGLSSSVFLREDANSEFFTLGEDHPEDASLFPSYESPLSPPPALDLESATEAESSIASEASVISKEQLLSMLSRSRSRVHKYKSRYALLQKAYQDVSTENQKISTVMQQTQDKALRRISELREQCQLSQKAKQHLEEELRGDMEEKEHIIKTLETKVALLKSGGETINKNGDDACESPLVVIDMDEKPSPAAQEKMIHLEEKVKRLENLLTKCKESITANKQKIAALVEVKESLSKQLSDKSLELSTLTSKYEQETSLLKGERDEALQTCESLRTKDQNDELQIAESKLMVHQEMITKDEEISKLRRNLQMVTNDRDSQTQTIVELNNEISQLTAAQKTLERSLIEEKSSTLQELSRGQTEAMETYKTQLEEERNRLSSEFAQEKLNLKKSHEEEQQKAINKVQLEKKRELRILEDEMKAKLVEKDNENRLAIEESELRIKSLVAADEKKSELLRDLEMNLKLLSKDKALKEKEIENILKEVSILKAEKEKADKSFSDQEEALKIELGHFRSQAESDRAKVEELNNMKLDLLSQIESKDSLIRGLEESRSSQDSLECRYYNESLPDIIQSKEDEINRVKEESKLEISVLKEELAQLKLENMDLRNKSLQENPSNSELEEKKQEVIKLEGEVGSLLAAKQDLEATFNTYKDEQEAEKEAIRKQQKLESIDALSKKDELIKTISLESSNEMEKLKKELHELRKDSDTNLENLKSVNESKISKLEAKHSATLSKVEEKHLKEIEEMNLKISELRQGKNVEFLEENSKLQKNLSSLEEKFKSLSEELSETVRQKTQVQKNLEEKLLEIDRIKESHKNTKDLENSLNDHEKEIASLRERERSQKDLEAQMIRYQKELQSQIKRLEDRDEEKNNIIHDLRLESDNKSLEIKKNAEKFDRQVSDLKQDLEMKIRVERDRENAHSELKRQSIEYQKKLQEQLQEKESFLTAAKDEISCFEGKISNLNNLHSREIERLSNRISELTQTVKELEERRDCDIDLNEKTLKECDSLRDNISALTEDLKKKEDEISHLKETEISLNAQLQENRSKECVNCPSLHTDIKSLNGELSSLKEVEKSLRQEMESKSVSYHDLEKEISDKNAEVKRLAEKEIELQESLNSQTILLSEKETSYLGLIDQIKSLKESLESIQDEKGVLAADFAELELKLKENTSSTSDNMKLQFEELESKLKEAKEENDDLVMQLKSKHEQELASVLRRQEERVSEMEELFDSEKKNYENSIEELSGKILKLQEENASHSWGGWDHEPIDLQNHIQSFNQNEDSIQEHSIATLKISNNNRTNSSFGCSLEEAAEFEYLKNILYQYMLGKESLTLAKVLATVVKFNQEQINKIMLHEEQKKSLLSAFGLHNS